MTIDGLDFFIGGRSKDHTWSFLTLRNSCKIARQSKKQTKEESITSEFVKVTSQATKLEAIGKIDVARRSLTMNGWRKKEES